MHIPVYNANIFGAVNESRLWLDFYFMKLSIDEEGGFKDAYVRYRLIWFFSDANNIPEPKHACTLLSVICSRAYDTTYCAMRIYLKVSDP